jgi:hypothetical protein
MYDWKCRNSYSLPVSGFKLIINTDQTYLIEGFRGKNDIKLSLADILDR